MTDKLHATAWKQMRWSRGMLYMRDSAEYPLDSVAQAWQLDGPKWSWGSHEDRPRAHWECTHPKTGEHVGGGVDGIVPAMEMADRTLKEWGIVPLGEIRGNIGGDDD